MEKLTKEQITEIKILVRLGDSLELAIETVTKKKNNKSKIYYTAYNL